VDGRRRGAGLERRYKRDARATHCPELIEQLAQSPVAVPSRSSDFLLIVYRQAGLVLVEDQSNATDEISFVFLEQMADNFLDASLASTRVPRKGGAWQRLEKIPQRNRGIPEDHYHVV